MVFIGRIHSFVTIQVLRKRVIFNSLQTTNFRLLTGIKSVNSYLTI